jgi:pyruvate/2-oxoglutarate dehydrogenase complex dihydrolipoamide acyltransferase (E2) component
MSELSPINRRQVVFALAALPLACSSPRDQTQVKQVRKILFVCQAGTVKSAIAREVARKMARERGIEIEFRSRGIAPEDHVTPDMLARLEAKAVDPRSEPVAALTQADLDAADMVVAFNRLPPAMKAPNLRDWTDSPAFSEDHDRAMAAIESRVSSLLDELTR